MNRQQIISEIMNSKDENTSKPDTLIHFVGGTYHPGDDVINSVKANGLSADYGNWDDVSQFVPHRPKGNFFWGPEKAGEGAVEVRVKVADLDTSKLWAFPSMAAWAADEMAKGIKGIEGLEEALAEIKPVAWDDYNGEFHAEFIYTADVPAEVLK